MKIQMDIRISHQILIKGITMINQSATSLWEIFLTLLNLKGLILRAILTQIGSKITKIIQMIRVLQTIRICIRIMVSRKITVSAITMEWFTVMDTIRMRGQAIAIMEI